MAILVPVVLAAAGCSAGAAEDRVLFELERMAFVPPGRCDLAGRPVEVRGLDLRQALHVVDPLLVDRFEVTRADWEHHMGAAPDPSGLDDPLARTSDTPPSHGDARWSWPAFCDLDEARQLARARGMRLLTAGEWMYVAAGSGLQSFPWGKTRRLSVANTLELGLWRPVAVGTFESGRSASGCYDLIGNAMEWVEGSLPPISGEEWFDPAVPSAMGGSFLLTLDELWTATTSAPAGPIDFNCLPLPAGSRSVDLGVRCAAEAEPFLLAQLPQIVANADTRNRLVALGETWGRPALPLLERMLSDGPPAGARFGIEALIEGARR
ncbi:Formylglycine-generating sulfatase enzyme [Planctomycetes bacterium Pla163]|uniref:Formylglycine-generating sulfatase enzyme n=1 Tax=Rohdeia mirabilis TaxID=2528008 RepID=A0A518D1N4_9BACT|nr:Formylglycine-generating sulfatase enzyme [Planctomycetes bacterium Pla163]